MTSYGNYAAAPSFYKSLRLVAQEEGIPFIVNETKTGTGQTGKMWGHEHWYLQDRDGGAPDLVTFGGKAGISGYFSTLDFREGGSADQTVDMVKLLNFGVTWREIQDRELLKLVWDTSTFLKIELNNIARDTGVISDVRGNGTFLGFDLSDPSHADSMHRWLLKRGIVTARAGPATLGLRPALILGPSHAAHLREAVRSFHPNHAYNE